MTDVKRRNPKLIKDEAYLGDAHDEEDPKSTVAQIHKTRKRNNLHQVCIETNFYLYMK